MTDSANDNVCAECGEPLDPQEEFNARADMIEAALDGADPEDQMGLLVMFLSLWLAQWRAEDREDARSDIIEMLDEDTRSWVMQGCDA